MSDSASASVIGSRFETGAWRRAVAPLAVLALLVTPVTVFADGPRTTLVFAWGLVNVTPETPGSLVHAYTIVEYFGNPRQSYGSLPASLQAWPLALGLHLLAVASALVGGLSGREDRRVTGGLLVLAGIASLWVTLGLASRVAATVGTEAGLVVPVGALATWLVAVGLYRRDLRAIASIGG